MQSNLGSDITNRKTIFLYFLIFRWLSLAYVLFFFLVQKSVFQRFNYYVVFFAILYVLCLTLLYPAIHKQVSRRPILVGIDVLICALFLILGGWPRVWLFYSLTPIFAAALFWGSIQGFIFAAVISFVYLWSLNLNATLFSGRQNFVRFENFLFPIASSLFAATAVTLFFHQRQRNLKSMEDLEAKLSQESNKLGKVESKASNKIIEAVRGAALMMGLKEPEKIRSLLVEQTRKVTQAEKAVVALFNRESGKVEIDPGTLAVKGRKDQHLESWWKNELNEMTKMILEKESHRESHESLEESRLLADCVLRKSSENSSLLCVPLKASNRYIGILSALNTYPHFFSDDEINLLSVLAEQAATALTELERSKEQPKVSNLEFEEELERVTTKCLQSQEAERKRISRELHDNTAQSLTHLVIRLQKMNTSIPPEQTDFKNTMSKLIDIAERTLADVHEMAFQMRPAILEDLGLVETIRWYISHYLGTATLSINFATKEKEVKLPPHVEIAVLRIVQEALTNIRKYARASEAFVNLDLVGDQLVVSIEDNGEGFDVQETLAKSAEKKALGIKGMKERAELLGGSLEIISQPGQGTRITANMPLRFRR